MSDVKIKIDSIKLVPTKDLKQNPKNRNHHPQDQIEELARHYAVHGMRTPIIVSNQTKHIVSGNGRFLAALRAGLDQVPVSYQDFDSPEMEYAFGVADNGLSLWSELDMAGINNDLSDLGPDFNIDDLGIKDFTLDVSEKYEDKDPDEIPEVVEPKAKLGEIYKLGNHRLMCGDSTKIEDVEKLMNGEKADMVFTDPPYNQTATGGKTGMIGKAMAKINAEIEHMCDFDPTEFLNNIPLVFEKGKMNALIFCNKDLVVDYLKWSRDSKYAYNILVWKKPTAIPIGASYRPDVEYLLAFRRDGIWNAYVEGVSYSKVLEHGREKDKVHPTMKPVEMIENQLKISSNSGSIIMDFFGGSGSTLIACEKTNRKCFMMELDPHYIDVIIARWENFTGQKAELING